MKRSHLAALLAVIAIIVAGVLRASHLQLEVLDFVIILSGLILAIVLANEAFQKYHQKKKLRTTDKLSIESAQENSQRFENLFENSNFCIALFSLEGRFFKVNKTLCNAFGYAENEMLTLNYFDMANQKDAENLQFNIQNLLAGRTLSFRREQQFLNRSGEDVWLLSTVSLLRNEKGDPLYFILQAQNITALKNAENRIKHLTYHDTLTGLANKNKLEQYINNLLSSSRRHHVGFAVLFLDIDRFKIINDTIGHEAGDLLLQIVADRLNKTVRNTDLVARLSGDEFVLVITDVHKSENVAVIAQKILNSILQVMVINGQELYMTASIGISLYPYDGHNMHSLMKNADLALYRCKEQDSNSYQFYTEEMTIKAREKIALQNALAQALIKEEFYLHYQPKINVKTKKVTGIEVYLRWNNKNYNSIMPGEIITIAEESGLIISVGDWIIETACKQMKAWQEMGLPALTLSLNCSSRQFKQTGFVDKIFATISKIGILPNQIEFDVPEKIIMDDPENILRVLISLKDLGMHITIDNFGTGYWSLNNLRRLNVDGVKIDKSFTKYVLIDETSAAITMAIIAMAKKLGIKSIAHGVENKEQYDFLLKEGCDEMQGYYLTPPLGVSGMTTYLRTKALGVEITSNKETL